MNNAAEEKLLIDYLGGDSEFSQRYKNLDADEVPVEIDNQIIAQATQDVAGKSRQHKKWRTWSAPLAMAATLVLTVSILIQSNDRAPTALVQAPTNKVAEKAKDIGRGDSRAREEDTRSMASTSASDKNQPTTTVQITTSSQPSRLPSPAIPSTHKQSPPASTLENVVVTNARRSQSAQDASLPISVVESQASAVAAAPAEPITAARASGAVVAEEKPPTTVVSSQRRQDFSKPGETAELEEAIVTAIKKPTAAERKLAKQTREADPAVWLQYIRELRMAGKNFSANGEWQRFKKAYPLYVVADDDSARRK